MDEIGICDFCMKSLKVSDMQCLSDGRMRCPECSEDAVDDESYFLELQKTAHGLFLRYLGIDFSAIPHTASMVSAAELHQIGGVEFRTTNRYDARKIIGLVFPEKKIYYIENGRKSLETLENIIHELTHIWQSSSEAFKRLEANNKDWSEGLALWTDLFLTDKYLKEQGLPGNFDERKGLWYYCNDEYGRGLRLIDDLCPDDPYGYIENKR